MSGVVSGSADLSGCVAGRSAAGWGGRRAGERGGQLVKPGRCAAMGSHWRCCPWVIRAALCSKPVAQRVAFAGGELAVEEVVWVQAMKSQAVSASSSHTALIGKGREGSRLNRCPDAADASLDSGVRGVWPPARRVARSRCRWRRS